MPTGVFIVEKLVRTELMMNFYAFNFNKVKIPQERLQVTTKVYFKGADFSDVQDLKGLYHDLNTTNWRDKLAHGRWNLHICFPLSCSLFFQLFVIMEKDHCDYNYI